MNIRLSQIRLTGMNCIIYSGAQICTAALVKAITLQACAYVLVCFKSIVSLVQRYLLHLKLI